MFICNRLIIAQPIDKKEHVYTIFSQYVKVLHAVFCIYRLICAIQISCVYNISPQVLIQKREYSILFYYGYSMKSILRRDSHGGRNQREKQFYLGSHQG